MDGNKIIKKINKTVFNRADIYAATVADYPDFKESSMRNFLEVLLKDNVIIRVGRNRYRANDNKIAYEGKLSVDANKIIKAIMNEYSYVGFQVWELSWLNEFLNHLVAQNRIFLDVENDGCEYVYTSLRDTFKNRLLLRPAEKELDYYSEDGMIIIDRLISESPNGVQNKSPLEKIIVDLFANRSVSSMISKGDYPDMLERMFSKYVIDQSKLFRYARRRNKDKVIYDYIKNNTDIELIVEV